MAPRNYTDISHWVNVNEDNSKQMYRYLTNLAVFNFSQWIKGDLARLSRFCSIQNYPPETIIKNNDSDDFVYFILTGTVRYIVNINFNQITRVGKDERIKNCTKKLQICILTSGQYFAVGEDLPQASVITNEEVTCFLIFKKYLINNHAWFYERLRDALTSNLPTGEEIVKRYQIIKKWKSFKKKILKEALIQCKLNRHISIMF